MGYQLKAAALKMVFVLFLSYSLHSCQLIARYIVPLSITAIQLSSEIGAILKQTTLGYFAEKGLDWLLGVEREPKADSSGNTSGGSAIQVEPYYNNDPNKGIALQSIRVKVFGSREQGNPEVNTTIQVPRKHLIYERIGEGYDWHPTIETKRLLRERMITGSVQISLLDLGYNPGEVDGKYGPRTKAAIKSFQKNSGMTATGAIDNATIVSLLGVEFLNSLNER